MPIGMSALSEKKEHPIIFSTPMVQAIYEKKVELEKAERDFLSSSAYVDLYEELVSLLEIINDGLDEWQGIEAVHCPDELQLFKTAQEKVKELIHDLEV